MPCTLENTQPIQNHHISTLHNHQPHHNSHEWWRPPPKGAPRWRHHSPTMSHYLLAPPPPQIKKTKNRKKLLKTREQQQWSRRQPLSTAAITGTARLRLRPATCFARGSCRLENPRKQKRRSFSATTLPETTIRSGNMRGGGDLGLWGRVSGGSGGGEGDRKGFLRGVSSGIWATTKRRRSLSTP